MILQRIRIIVGDARFETERSASEVWCATNEPPHLLVNFIWWPLSCLAALAPGRQTESASSQVRIRHLTQWSWCAAGSLCNYVEKRRVRKPTPEAKKYKFFFLSGGGGGGTLSCLAALVSRRTESAWSGWSAPWRWPTTGGRTGSPPSPQPPCCSRIAAVKKWTS